MLKHLNKVNPNMKIKSVFSNDFSQYGHIIDAFDFADLITEIKKTDVPSSGNYYIANDETCYNTVSNDVLNALFGEMPVQVGYVNGNNSKLNALEYHKASEVNIAVTDLVLLLGRVQDIRHNSYDSNRVEAFYIPQGTVIEVYGTTLHFAPCKVNDSGFKCAVLLPKGTNVSNISKTYPSQESKLLFKTNKWLLAHQEHKALIEQGAHVGINGENIEIYYK